MTKGQLFERWMLLILYTICVICTQKLYANWQEMQLGYRSLYASLLGIITVISALRLISTKN